MGIESRRSWLTSGDATEERGKATGSPHAPLTSRGCCYIRGGVLASLIVLLYVNASKIELWDATGSRFLTTREALVPVRTPGSIFLQERQPDVEGPVNCPGAGNTTVYLHYLTEGGLVNQLMGHMSAFLLARELRASVIMAPFQHRATFGAQPRAMQWKAARPSTIFDVRRMRDEWRAIGVGVYDVAPDFLRSASGVNGVESLYVDQVEPTRIAIEPSLAIRSRAKRRQPFDAFTADLCRTIATEVAAREDPQAGNATASRSRRPASVAIEDRDPSQDQVTPLVLAVGPLLLAFPLRDRAVWTRELVRTMPFAPHLVELANLAVSRAEARGLAPFDGVHLRLELDARPWFAQHGESWARERYERAMGLVGFDSQTPTFVASGLLSYDSGDSWELAVRDVLNPHSSTILHKGILLEEKEMAGLLSEELAAVDFLILLRARKYVGMAVSTYSFMVSEFRTTLGYSPEDSLLLYIPPFSREFLKTIAFADAARVARTRLDAPPTPPSQDDG